MPSTKLVLLERVPSFACVDTTEASNIEGFNRAPVPEPLLPNLGRASVTIYNTDITASQNHSYLILLFLNFFIF